MGEPIACGTQGIGVSVHASLADFPAAAGIVPRLTHPRFLQQIAARPERAVFFLHGEPKKEWQMTRSLNNKLLPLAPANYKEAIDHAGQMRMERVRNMMDS